MVGFFHFYFQEESGNSEKKLLCFSDEAMAKVRCRKFWQKKWNLEFRYLELH